MGGTYLITEDILTGKDEPELFFKKVEIKRMLNNVSN